MVLEILNLDGRERFFKVGEARSCCIHHGGNHCRLGLFQELWDHLLLLSLVSASTVVEVMRDFVLIRKV